MRTYWNIASILVLGSMMLVGAVLILSANNSTATGVNQPTYSTRNLIGDTPEEVEQYALSYVSKHLIVSGTPQVLLVRPITGLSATKEANDENAMEPSIGFGARECNSCEYDSCPLR